MWEYPLTPEAGLLGREHRLRAEAIRAMIEEAMGALGPEDRILAAHLPKVIDAIRENPEGCIRYDWKVPAQQLGRDTSTVSRMAAPLMARLALAWGVRRKKDEPTDQFVDRLVERYLARARDRPEE